MGIAIDIEPAVVVLAPGLAPDQAVSDRLSSLVRERVGKHATLRHVAYVDAIPKTPSGKIQRSALRLRWVADGIGGAVTIPPSQSS